MDKNFATDRISERHSSSIFHAETMPIAFFSLARLVSVVNCIAVSENT